MSIVVDADHPNVFMHQTDADVTTALPVINTWYTALATTGKVRIYGVGVIVDTANETLEVRITVDGVVMAGAVAAVFGTWYFLHMNYTGAANSLLLLIQGNPEPYWYRAFLLEGRSVRVEYRKTTANGANPLYCRVKWARMV